MNRFYLSIILSIASVCLSAFAQEQPPETPRISSFTGEPITDPALPSVATPPEPSKTLAPQDAADSVTLPTIPQDPNIPSTPSTDSPNTEVMDPDLAPTISSSTPAASSTPQAQPLSITEVHRFQLQLAESTYMLTKDLKSRSELLLAYERLIGPVCMSLAHKKLNYTGIDPNNAECAELIEKAEALFEKSPILVCAKMGFENTDCITLTKSQPRGKIDFRASDGDSGKPLFDVEAKLQQSALEPKLKAINEGLDKISSDSSLSPEEQTKRLRRVYSFGIDTACRLFRIRLDNIGGTEEDPILRRTRLVTEECDDLVRRAERDVPSIPAIPCARYGYYSPMCIDAIRALRDEASLAPSPEASGEEPSRPTPQDNIGRF